MEEETTRVVVADSTVERESSPMPRWVIVALILVGIGVIWSVASADRSVEPDPVVDDVESAGDESPVRSRRVGTWVSVGGSGGTSRLRGVVALSSTIDGDDVHQTVWVLRPGGSVVRRDHVPSYSARSDELDDGLRSIVMVGDRLLVLDGTRSYALNSDLVDPAVEVEPARWIIPGSTGGAVWLVGQWSVEGVDVDWVTPVGTADLSVGDRIDVSNTIRWPVAAVGDGLIVHPVDVATNGRYAYWTPLGGLEPFEVRDPYASTVLASSGSLVAIGAPNEISVLDVDTGRRVAAFPADLLEEPIRAACISPEHRFIVVVGDNGQSFIGNLDSNVSYLLPKRVHGINSFGWSTDDQLVYITDWEFATALNAYDAVDRRNHHVADITDQQWSVATSSTC